MKVYKSLEREPDILGVSLAEAGLVGSVFLILFLAVGVIQMFFPLSGWWYGMPFLTVIGLYMILRFGAKQNQPNYLISWISFHFFQPKIIEGYDKYISPKAKES